MGRTGNKTITAQELLYGGPARIARTRLFWDEASAQPLHGSGGGFFCLDRESHRLVVRAKAAEEEVFSLPDGVDEIEESGKFGGWVAASWPAPGIFDDGLRVIGLGRSVASPRTGEILNTVSIPRHSWSYLTRDSEGGLQFSYVDRQGGLRIERLETGGVIEDRPVGTAWKIHDVRNDGRRNLMLSSSALGAPQGLSVYDIGQREKIAHIDTRVRPDHAQMSTLGDGTPVVSTIDRDGNLSVYVNNERLYSCPGADVMPALYDDRPLRLLQSGQPAYSQSSSWTVRDGEGSVYVVWRKKDSKDIYAARVRADSRGEFKVEDKLISDASKEISGVPRRPFLLEGQNGLYLGWASKASQPDTMEAWEVWFGAPDKVKGSPDRKFLAI